MDAAEYRRILDSGMGRAVRLLATGVAIPYDALLAACMRYGAFDAAIEGNRSAYLFRVIEATGDLTAFREPILAALTATAAHRYDLAQRFALAAHFAHREDEVARQAIYDAFTADTWRLWNPRDGSVIGAVEIVALDGWRGFLTVTEHLGALCERDERIWFTDGLLTLIERQLGAEAVTRALAPVMREHPHVASFVAEAERHRRAIATMHTRSSQETPLSLTQVRVLIGYAEERTVRRFLTQWGAAATEDDLAAAAYALTAAGNAAESAAYATIFARRPFPADPDPLLALARGRDHIAAQAALTALAQIAHPAVRALALELWDDPLRRVMALDLLVANYHPGDEGRIQDLLDTETVPQAWHWLGYGALNVFAAHPHADAETALCLIYERTPCSHCRHRAVRLLQTLGRLPTEIASECRHDAHPGTRALVAGTTAPPVMRMTA